MNLITPIILIIVSIGVFFAYVDPNYRGTDPQNKSIQVLQAENKEYLDALNNSNKIREKRQSLTTKMAQFNPEKVKDLERLLPNNVDNIKLVINVQDIARKPQNGGLVLKNVKFDTTAASTDSKKLGADNSKYGTVTMTFSVTASYDNFNLFIKDLEKSLRLVDITDLSVTGNDSGLYEFGVTLKTYWLK
jgi:Tfp pilus assembly protein PilO